MPKLAIIDKNKNARLSQWRAAPDPKKFFSSDNAVISLLDVYKPDFVFINKGNLFTGIFPTIKKYKSVYFYGDYYRPIPAYVYEYAKVCDAVVLTNKDQGLWKELRAACNQKNIFFVSQGVDTDVFKPIENTPKIYDIVFGGNYFGPSFLGSDIRLALVEHLLKSPYKFQVIGDGWPDYVNALPRQNHSDLNLSINQSRLTVGMSHFVDVSCYTSNRLYQFMATGVPHIAWDSPGIKTLFRHGYYSIDSYEKLDNAIKNFLENQTTSEFIGKSQAKEIRNRHTIYHTWQKIEEIFYLI